MKRTIFSIVISVFLFACKKEKTIEGISTPSLPTNSSKSNISSMVRYSESDYSQAISISEANQMIGSYLSSINYAETVY